MPLNLNRYCQAFAILSGNNIDQTAHAYNLNTCNKALIKNRRVELKQLRLGRLKHLLIFIIVNLVIIFNMLPKLLQ